MIRLGMLACLLLTGCCCCPNSPVASAAGPGPGPVSVPLKWGNGAPVTTPCLSGRVLTSNPPQHAKSPGDNRPPCIYFDTRNSVIYP